MSKAMAALAALGLVAALAGPAAAKPVTVFEDAAGDAGNQDSGLPGFDQAGFDLVKGTIDKKGKNLIFTVEHAAMPSTGTPGELFRLLWHFAVGGEQYRVTAKSIDIGKPDVLAQSGTERVGQVDTDGHFRLEQCAEEATPAITLINCRAIEYLEGGFDPASATLMFVVPMKLIKAKPGTVISGGTSGAASSGCMICWVPHYAERSLTPLTIIDSATMTTSYKVPKR